MQEKNKGQNNANEQNQKEIKDDSGNIISSKSGPNFDRLLIAVGICVTLLVIAKLMGL